jgi:hypothetical protein
LVVLGESELDVARTRVLVQAARQGKEISQDFSSYVDAAFPYRKSVEEDVKKAQAKVLKEWTAVEKIPIVPTERSDPHKGQREMQRERGKRLTPPPKELPKAWSPKQYARSASSTGTAFVRSPVQLLSTLGQTPG